MSSELIFAVQHVSYTYPGGQLALADVNLQVTRGETAVVVGANGSGKSTLLKLLDALFFPTAGTITAFGRPLDQALMENDAANFAFRRKVGLVFQDPDVQIFLPSVLDELAFAPLQLGIDRADVERRVEGALTDLRIESLRHRPPHQLSGGEKRRVALASVLTLRPDVWLLDEPSAGLDPRSHSWLIEFIREQHQQGRTIIAATHDLALAEEIATRIHVFSEDHRIVASGPPDEILADHDLLHRCNLYHYHVRAASHHPK